MLTTRHPIALTLCLATLTCQRDPAPPPTAAPGEPRATSWAVDLAPEALRPRVAVAEGAMGALMKTLSQRVMAEMKAGGAERAITVCRDEAPALTAQVAGETGIELGRTSARLRSTKNAPRQWLRDFVGAHARDKAADTPTQVFDLGPRLGVARPIAMGTMCLPCHGDLASLAPAVKEALGASYPDDQAVGFAAGDLRGWFWAELDK